MQTQPAPDAGRIDDALLDRLVDGELSDVERRTLLARLDLEPDGWKRCARAFLEAQCWRTALVEKPLLVAAPPPCKIDRRRSPGMFLAVAAGLLLAFGAGLSLGLRGPAESSAARAPTADLRPLLAAGVDAPVNPAVHEIGQWHFPPNGVVQVPGVPGMQITVFEGAGIDEAWLKRQPYSVPDLVSKQLERQGCRLHQERRCLPMELADGRRLAVLIDQNQLQVVGRRPML